MTEATRTAIHKSDTDQMSDATDQRDVIHNQDYIQFSEIKRTLDSHIVLQKMTDKATSEKLDSLLPLVRLIPVLQSISEKEDASKAVSGWLVKIGKGIGFVAVILSSIGIIIGAAWVIISAIIDIKK